MPDIRKLTVEISADLHSRVRADQLSREITLNQYIAQALEDYMNKKEGTNMDANNKTLAVQISLVLSERLDSYLHGKKLSKKALIITLIEKFLDEEDNASGKDAPDTFRTSGEGQNESDGDPSENLGDPDEGDDVSGEDPSGAE